MTHKSASHTSNRAGHLGLQHLLGLLWSLQHCGCMTKTCGIYLITCTTTSGKNYYYVGQSVHMERRFGSHLCSLRAGRHHNRIMKRLWAKYGEQSFKFELLEECSQESLNVYENWWLTEMVGHKFCMNIGVDAAAPLAGVKLTTAHKEKISLNGRGVKRSVESKKRYSEANKGSRNSMFGKTGLQNARSRPVIGFPVDGGDTIRLDSAHSGVEKGFSQAEITNCCRGRYLTHRGYVWEYDIGPDTVPTKGPSKRFEPTRNQGGRFERWNPIKDQTHQRLQIEPQTGAVSELPQILI